SAPTAKARTPRRRRSGSAKRGDSSGRYRNSRYLSRQRNASYHVALDQVVAASRIAKRASEIRERGSSIICRVRSRRFPCSSQHTRNRVVAISESDVETGMLNPITTASHRDAVRKMHSASDSTEQADAAAGRT